MVGITVGDWWRCVRACVCACVCVCVRACVCVCVCVCVVLLVSLVLPCTPCLRRSRVDAGRESSCSAARNCARLLVSATVATALALCCHLAVLSGPSSLTSPSPSSYALYANHQHGFQEEATRQILGCVVLTRYNNRTYRVDDIVWDKNPQSTFVDSSGQPIRFLDYYK